MILKRLKSELKYDLLNRKLIDLNNLIIKVLTL